MSSTPVRRPRRWLWFFLFLATVPVVLLGVEIWANLSQQLTPQKLAAARALWAEKGPRDYELDYEVKRGEVADPSSHVGDKYTVRVRDGKAEAPPPDEFGSMDDLFDWIGQRLREDRQPGGPRVFAVLTFKGDEVHYVRSVMRTRERIEVTAKFRPLAPSGGWGKR